MRTLARTRTALLAVLLVTVLAACGGSDTAGDAAPEAATAESSDAGSTAAPAELSEAEVTFLQDMIPHHAQAVEMSALVADRAEHDELIGLAEQITSSQDTEIEQMNQLLEGAGEEPVDVGGGMDHSMGGEMGGEMSMPGMMSPEEMSQLETLSGNEFDLAFIDAMSAHHQGAIEMANEVLDTDASPAITELAEGIIAAQEAELEQMAQWREEWAA
jgi:uncharacterized protein (DUF305 family)